MGRNILHRPLLLVVGLVVFLNHWLQPLHAYSSSPKAQRGRDKNQNLPPSSSSWQERTVVLLYHKPANVVTSHVAEDARPTVYDEIQSMKGFVIGGPDQKNGRPPTNPQDTSQVSSQSFEQMTGIRSKLHAIGRLDADTTGLLLLTNDGGLVHHVTNPQAGTQFHDRGIKSKTTTTSTAIQPSSPLITKTYEALIMGHHDATSLRPLWEGVDIGSKYGGITRPVDNVQILNHPNHKSTWVAITISEGRNRQVRRMFHALGSGVMKLKLVQIGHHLCIEGLQEGTWRILSEDEVRIGLAWQSRILTTTLSQRAVHDSPSSSSKKKSTPSWTRNQQKRR